MEKQLFHINELCVKVTDGSHFSPVESVDGNYPMFSVKDMEYNGFSYENCKYIDLETYKVLERNDCRPLKNDILIAKDGSYLKCVFKVKEDMDACILSSIAILRPNVKVIDPDYFVYLLRTKSIKSAMASYVSGSALPRIILSDFKKMKLNLFENINYQKQISNTLIKYDTLIENNKNRVKLLENIAEELYKEWFVRFRFPGYEDAEFENGIPKGWKISKIKYLVKRLPFNKTYKESELYSEGDIIVIDQSTSEYLGYHLGVPSHKASYNEPKLLFGDHSCKYKLMCVDFSLGENVIPYISNNESIIKNYFLYFSTKGILKTEEYKRHWSRFVNFKILVPDINLQEKYANFIKNIKKEQDEMFKINKNLIKQRDSLLPRLMSGKLSVEGKEII